MSIGIVLIWAFAVSLSGVMSALICGITLERRYSRSIVILGYGAAYFIGFVLTFFIYYLDILNDFGGIVGMSAVIWGACALLHKEHWSSKWFVAIMATLISNVSTFFICGPTVSFIVRVSNPYNITTISIFIGLKLVLFTLLFLLYKMKLRRTIRRGIESLDGKMSGYLPVALASFFGFYMINLITNSMGIIPSAITKSQIEQAMTLPEGFEIRYIFIAIYGVISLIFIFEFWQIFSSIFWSSRALKTEAELSDASKVQYYMQCKQESDERVQVLSHDLKHSLIQWRKLAEEKGDADTLESISEYERQLYSCAMVNVENESANAVINEKCLEARQAQVEFQVDGAFYEDLCISKLDLCSLLGNLLDNAIEAAA
ncbi:MAG: GHKL domain-containing protein [Firmicutes bacterium]|nr:GHKL domain-containing protein [Bacillota bacterium]